MGSNHLLANLHYQENIFSFQEGTVEFPSATLESLDVFGLGKTNEARNLKFNSSEYFVWKLDRRHTHYNLAKDIAPYKGYLEYFDPNDLMIFYMRHPYSTFQSHQKVSSKELESMLYDYEVIFREIHKAGKKGSIRIHTTFYERIIEDYDKTMRGILNQLNFEYEKIYNYQDYFQNVQQITGQNKIPTGSGGYRPARIVKFYDVLKSIKGHEGLIDKVYQRCAKNYPSEQLLQFKNFYTNLHNRI